jgi:hypothetical protein
MLATLALTATTAWAQGGDVSGTVAYVDAATRTIHLTDRGRWSPSTAASFRSRR